MPLTHCCTASLQLYVPAGTSSTARLSSADLGVVKPGATTASATANMTDAGPGRPTNAGGAFVQASADAVDDPGFLSTRDVGAAAPGPNVQGETNTRGTASRYEVTRGLGQGLADVSGRGRLPRVLELTPAGSG